MIRIFCVNFLFLSAISFFGILADAQTATADTKWCDKKILDTGDPQCQICEEFEDGVTAVWSGNCTNGRADGPGELWWYNNGELNWITESTRFSGYRDGFWYTDYTSDALVVHYVMDNGSATTECLPEVRNNSIVMPEIEVEVAADFPLHRKDGMAYITKMISDNVNASCDKWLRQQGLEKYKNRIKLAIWVSKPGVELRQMCGFQGVRFDRITDCFTNPNNWSVNFNQFVSNIRQDNERQARQEREAAEKAARDAEKASFEAQLNQRKSAIDSEWKLELDRVISADAAIPNVADLFKYRPGEAMAIFSSGRKFVFTPRSAEFRDGRMLVRTEMRPTEIYASLDAMIAERQEGWDQWFAQIDKASSNSAFSIVCRVEPQYADQFSKQAMMTVMGKLVEFRNGQIVFDCSL